MKILTFFICIFLLFLFQSCKENKPTAPEDNTETPLTEATIGQEGGILGNDDFKLIIPEGALTNDIKISLNLETTEKPFGEEEISQLFRIDGFPSSFNKPIQIKIKYNTSINDSVSIAVGSKSRYIDSGGENVTYEIYDARDSAGYAILEISNTGGKSKAINYKNINTNSDEVQKWMIALVHQIKYKSKNGNFVIDYPKSVAEFIPSIDNYFEDALTEYFNLGFQKINKYELLLFWPVPVVIKDFSSDNKNKYCKICFLKMPIVDENFYRIKFEINKEKIISSEMNMLQKAIGSLNYYLFPFMKFVENFDNVGHFWFDRATSLWAEELFPRTNNYIPFEYSQDNFSVCNGMQSGAGKSSKECIYHGEGMAPFIKYLTNKYGEKIISKIFNNLEDNVSAVDAIIKSIEEPEYEWWPAFFNEYLSGNIYNLTSDKVMSQIKTEDVFNINNENDTLAYFSHTYSDLSSRFFKVNLNYQDIDEKAKLRFQVGPSSLNLNYVTVMVFGLKEGKLEYINQAADLKIENIRNLMSSGITTLIVCVINSSNEPPFTGSSTIDLEVSFKEDLKTIEFKKCILSFRIKGKYNYATHDTVQIDNIALGYWEVNNGITIEGNQFTAKWDTSDIGVDDYGYEYERSASIYLSGTIDLENKTITDLYAENKKVDYNQLLFRNLTTKSIRVVDFTIPKVAEGSDWFKCEIKGSDIDLSKLVVVDKVEGYYFRENSHEWLEIDYPYEDSDNDIYIYFYY